MDKPPEVPGLTLLRLLGRGGHGEVWLADDATTGDRVAVKLGAEMRLLEPELALLGRIDHPHVLRLIRVLPAGAGSAMVLPLAAAGSLAELVARRGPLAAGEVSTMLVPLAAAVEHLHRRGVAHGDLTPGNVLFEADGKPLLGDLGAARLIGITVDKPWQTEGFIDPAIATGADPRAVDVWGLGAVAWFALTGRPPTGRPPAGRPAIGNPVANLAGYPAGLGSAALVRLLEECLAPDPAVRPDPTEIARRAWEVAPPTPIRLARPDPGPVAPARLVTAPAVRGAVPSFSQQLTAPSAVPSFSQQVTTPPAARSSPPPEKPDDAPPSGRSRRLLLAGGGSAIATALIVAVVLLTDGGAARPTATPATPVETAPSDPANLTLVVQQLGAARAAAFHAVSLDQLAWADEAGSPAARADARLITRLRKAGRRLDDLRFTVSQVRQSPSAGTVADDTITLSAQVATSAYRQVEVDGGAAVAMPAQPAQQVTLTLARVDSAWRVRSIESVGAG